MPQYMANRTRISSECDCIAVPSISPRDIGLDRITTTVMPEDPSKPADHSSGSNSESSPEASAATGTQRGAEARAQAESHYYAALDHVADGDDNHAVDEYRQSLAADPAFTDALHGLSRALQNLDRLDEAIEVANQISALDPDDVLAHTSLSILYQKKGMVPEAEAEANKARILGWKQQLKGNKSS